MCVCVCIGFILSIIATLTSLSPQLGESSNTENLKHKLKNVVKNINSEIGRLCISFTWGLI